MTSSSNSPSPIPRAPKFFYRLFVVAYFIALTATIAYLWTLAQNRYMTSAAFKISHQDSSAGTSTLSALAIPGLSDSDSMDSQLAIGYLQSADFLVAMENDLDLRKHYSSPRMDWFFRLDSDAPLEERLDYYRKHISAEFDTTTGLTLLTVQTFDPQLSHRIAVLALEKADSFINGLNKTIADQRLSFIRTEFDRTVKLADEANRKVIDFQNEHKLINPDDDITHNLGAVQTLRMERLNQEADLKSLLKDSPQSPRIEAITSRMATLDQLIAAEMEKLSGPDRGRLNQLLSDFQELKLKLDFAVQMRSGAQMLLEKTRVDAMATSRFFSVIQQPFIPEDVAAPRRGYATATILVLGLFLFLIIRGLIKSAMERF